MLVFDEAAAASAGTWTLVRPLLPVVLAAELIRPDVLEDFKNELVASQPAELRARMNDEFLKLARDITRSLDVINRDRFVNRLTAFRATVRDFYVTAPQR